MKLKAISPESFSYNYLAPVVHYYLMQLDHYLRQMDDGDTKFLFVSRAGVRIRKLYEVYAKSAGIAPVLNHDYFWISRFLLNKCTFAKNEARAVNALGSELANHSLSEAIGFIFSSEVRAGNLDEQWWKDVPPMPLHEFVALDSDDTRKLKGYLRDQGQLFENYLLDTLGAAKRGILIDSGWKGTAQQILSEAFPDYEWGGLYFGKIIEDYHAVSSINPYMVGLVFDAAQYDEASPETCFVLHRHLIESLFEPNATSIERLVMGKDGKVCSPESNLILSERVDPIEDAHYLAVVKYLNENKGGGASEIYNRYKLAVREIARMLSRPSREEAKAIEGKKRSADFGREIKVPVLLEPKNRNQWDNPEKRLRDALWLQGQIALEYPENIARSKQIQSLSTNLVPRKKAALGKVAIITRTKDRPILLERAARSVASQTYENYVWVIVNDGGDIEPVKSVIRNSAVDPRKIILCSNKYSLGMEAASNTGVKASESDYIIIHDDDDSWEPDFLQEMAAFLESKDGKKYGGAISKTTYISESIEGDSVIEHGRYPYQEWVTTVPLSEMMCGNFFAPIAFLFKRKIYEKIGGFDENLPVLGDWDFNIRFLMEADIGVVPLVLANYHHRDIAQGQGAGAYSNSVIGGVSKHNEYNAIVRNKFARMALASESNVAGIVGLLGYSMIDLRSRIDSTKHAMDANVNVFSEELERRLANERISTQTFMKSSDDHWVLSQCISLSQKKRGLFKKDENLEYLTKVFSGGASIDREQLVKIIMELDGNILPPSNFNDSRYLIENPDVAEAVRSGAMKNGFHHFYLYGFHEGRKRAH